MQYDPDKEFVKSLNWAKNNNDFFSLAFLVEGSKEHKKQIKPEHLKKFDEFRKTPEYAKLLTNAIKMFRGKIDNTEKIVVKYGWSNKWHYENRDLHNDDKRHLKSLEAESKKN